MRAALTRILERSQKGVACVVVLKYSSGQTWEANSAKGGGGVPQESIRAIVEDMIAAYQRSDSDRLAARYHEDVDWLLYAPVSLFPFAGARHGKAEVFKGFALMYEAYRPVNYEVQVLLVDGDRAAMQAEAHMEQRATGRVIQVRLANFHRFQDGLLIEYRGFMDSFDAAEQVLGRELDL